MNKKTLIIAGAVLLLTAGLAVFLFLPKPGQNPPQDIVSANYQFSASYTGGNLYATVISGSQTLNLTEANADRYGIVGFNKTKDILWVTCPDSYITSGATSTTNSKITFDPSTGYHSTNLEPDKTSNVTLTCVKRN